MPPNEAQVAVYNPDGILGSVPASQLPLALANNYKTRDSVVEAIHPETGQVGLVPKGQWTAAQGQMYAKTPRQAAYDQLQGSMPKDTYVGPDYLRNARATGPSISYRGAQPPRNPETEQTLGALPWVAGGTAAALTGGASIPIQAGMAAATGTLGSLAQQGLEKFGSQRKYVSGTEAIEKGAEVGGTELAGGLASKYAITPLIKAGGELIQRMQGMAPEQIAYLRQLFPAKQAVESAVTQAEARSRDAFHTAYDLMGIDSAKVNVNAAQNFAKGAINDISSTGATAVPRAARQVANIPAPSESLIAPDTPIDQVLSKLRDWNEMPFRDVQQMRANIENYIAKSHPAANVYASLKQITGSLGDALKATAEREGKLVDFNWANQLFKEHVADFWTKNAPLKTMLDAPVSTNPTTARTFFNRVNDQRILGALEKRGVNTDVLRGILAKAGTLGQDLKDAATLENLGQGTLDRHVAEVNRAALKKEAIGYAAKYLAPALIGGGALGGAIDWGMKKWGH